MQLNPACQHILNGVLQESQSATATPAEPGELSLRLAKAGGRDAAGNGRWKIKIEGISQAFFFISTIRADGGYP